MLLCIKWRIQQDVTKADHGIHWRADFMTHVGQECRPGRGGLLCFILCNHQVVFHLPAVGDVHDKTIQPEDVAVVITDIPAMLTQPADLTRFVEDTVFHTVFGLANQCLLNCLEIIGMKQINKTYRCVW